jgi:hypothetical protein
VAEAQNVQTSFLSGVLDPRAKGRIDTDAYAQGLLLGVNIEPIHLGGIRRRRGTRFLDRLPYQLTRRTGMTITAPNGGTTANANDDDESTLVTTTNNVGTTNPYVVVHYDMGSALAVYAADVLGIVSTGGTSTQFRVQYSTDNASWTDYGAAFEAVDTTARSYRRTNTAFHTPISARYWRVAKVGGTDMGAVKISISGLHVWNQGSTISNVRLFNFEVDADNRYVLAITDRSGALYDSAGALYARVPLPYANDDIPDIDAATSAETMVLVHEDYAPRFIFQELSGFFTTEAVSFDTVPQHDYADSSSPTPVSDIQVITFGTSGWVAGDTFQLDLEGARTAAITYAGDATADEQMATAENIAREVQKLYTVEGFTGVSCVRTGTLQYTVTFAGASAGAYDLLTIIPLDTSGKVGTSNSVLVTTIAQQFTLRQATGASVAQTTKGTPRAEDVWSAVRGWPRTVAFFEGRLYFGGTRSRQQTLFGSRVSSIIDFETGEGRAADPIQVTLDGANAIQGLFGGRSFEIFTSSGEYRFVKPQGEAITPSDVPKSQTFNGAAKIRPVNVDGATVFVQRKRKSIRDYKFNYEVDAYDSLGVSSLAPHLVYDVKDIAAYTGSRVDEINLVLVVNGTNASTRPGAFPAGTLAVLNTRKESNVQAWVVWQTDGEYRAVVTSFEDIFTAVKRTINGVDWLFFEMGDPDLYMDACVAPSVAGTAISGMSIYNGEELRVRADGFVLANVTPSAGAATVDDPNYVDVEVGLDFNPSLKPMPLATALPRGSSIGNKRRIKEVSIMVENTLGLRLNGRELPTRKTDVMNLDEAQAPYYGTLHLEETSNWDRDLDKVILLDQVDPLPMEILLIEAKLEG